MAFADSPLWLFLYRTAADEFKHLHLLQLNGAISPQHAKSEFFRHTNPDAKIERGGPISSPAITSEWLAKILKSDPEHRALKSGEQHLTIAQVAKINSGAGLDFLGFDDQPMSVPMDIEQLRAKAEQIQTSAL